MPRIPDDPTNLEPTDHMRALMKQLSDSRRARLTDPLMTLTALTSLRQLLDGYTQTLAWEALDLGYTWDEVGRAAGMSRSTAIRNIGPRKNPDA